MCIYVSWFSQEQDTLKSKFEMRILHGPETVSVQSEDNWIESFQKIIFQNIEIKSFCLWLS